ncbi:unnamed protein product [Discula destructiva]
MATAPPKPLIGRLSPQRASETYGDYVDRFKAHRDAGRQQFLTNYYRPKQARLPSPDSEAGLDDEEMVMEVAHIERDIRIENGRPEPGDLPNAVALWSQVVYPPGKSLSECSDYEDYHTELGGRPEDLEYEYQTWNGCLVPEPPSTLKRARSPFKGDALEPPVKRTRTDTTDTTSAVHPVGQRILGEKRKRCQLGDLQADGEEAQAVSRPKRRRADAHHTTMLPGATSSITRKRKSGSDEIHKSEIPTHRLLGAGRRAAGPKRRKMDEETRTSSAAAGKDRNRMAPVTRARRHQLSGTDAQLVQLGERGRLEMQRQVNKTQGRAADAAANRSIRMQSSTTITNSIEPETTIAKPRANNTIPKTSHTRIGAKRKTIASANTSNDTTTSAKIEAANEARTVTRSMGTRARKSQSKR